MTRRSTELLPWYVNHTLSPDEEHAAEEAAQQHPGELAVWQTVRLAMLSQPQRVPSATVRRQIMSLARQPQPSLWRTRWLPVFSGLTLALLALVVLWNVVRPGIGLQWSISGETPAAFQVYRAPLGSDHFEIVQQVPARPDALTYTFIDTALWPGQAYQYRVVAANVAASSARMDAISATIAANSAEALPAQLTIILSSLLLGLTATYLLQQVAAPPAWKFHAL